MVSSLLIYCFSKSFWRSSLRSSNSCSSFNLISRTSLLWDSSNPILLSKIKAYCLRLTMLFSYLILIFLSSFLYFFFYISSVTLRPLILSYSSMLYLSIFRLSLRRSSIAEFNISRLVSKSFILFLATVISV